ncbi:MAG TPA: hypothetical protein QF753_14270 [Victivallales bacterium]|nr:hypothetical protein [Victivallales bacterium]
MGKKLNFKELEKHSNQCPGFIINDSSSQLCPLCEEYYALSPTANNNDEKIEINLERRKR